MTKRTMISIILCLIVLVIGMLLLKKAEEKKLQQIEPSKPPQEEKATKPPAGAVREPELEQEPETKPVRSEPEKPEPELLPKVIITPMAIPQSLHVVMGMGEEKNYFVRVKQVHRLGKDLSYEEIQALYSLLNRKKGEDNLHFSKLNAIKNDIVNVLKKQEQLPRHLANNLMAMYHDKEHDNVWRDYCIQHLGLIYKKFPQGEKPAIAETLWEATDEKKISIAGTALIALTYNADDPLVERQEVAAKALELVNDQKCGELAKITALQICAKLDEKRVLPKARAIASLGGSVPLRMSAIAAVGMLGDESDRPMLEKYAKSNDVRLRTSARSALKGLTWSNHDRSK